MNTYDGGNNMGGNPYQQGAPYPNGAYNNFNNQSGGYGGNQVPQKAPNIFKQFLYAFMPSKYGHLTNVRVGGMIGFVTLMTFVATLILLISTSVRFFSIGELEEILDEIPDFEIRNGRFYIEEEFYVNQRGTIFYFTDEVDEFTYDDIKELRDEGYTEILLIGKYNLAMYQNMRYQELEFSELAPGTTFNKSWITDTLVPIIWICMFIGMLFFFVFRTLWYFACAAIYLLVGIVIASMMRKNISAGNLFKTAVYAKVLMFVVAFVLSLIPFASMIVIPGILKTTVRFMITVAFMCFAIQYVPQNR